MCVSNANTLTPTAPFPRERRGGGRRTRDFGVALLLSGDSESIGRGHRAGSAIGAEISRVLGRVFRPGGLSTPSPKIPGATPCRLFWRPSRGRGSSFLAWRPRRAEGESRRAGPYKTAREGPCDANGTIPDHERARGPSWTKGEKARQRRQRALDPACPTGPNRFSRAS